MLPCHTHNLFVVTGGPGGGKTTLVEALQATGLAVAPEAGRAIIRAQRAIGGPAGHDRDQALYGELMLSWELRSYEAARAAGSVHLFDRGIPDLIGYFRLIGLPVPPHMRKAAEMFRYNKTVFILPPWPEIYVQDEERQQTIEEAERTYESIRAAYEEAGYTLVHVPPAPVAERRDFVFTAIEAAYRR
ncbi:AAA family ATPase [Chelativorans salis]|uniref:AAA family ATPase n=1 Tax=Chelativorans salis TaxID=2978478 RepID=A0ABT2LKZ7_9HYPH|nr:AAA family ATPase [Chelativorans sp. EGI FJ00035]MCT7375054.1 AAA family ATPase [Chelativorans sp. EGI FJ00035]